MLDEPFSTLDARFAPPLRMLLRSLLWDRVSVVTTGQLLDALALADRLIALEAGRIVDERRYRNQLTGRPAGQLVAVDRRSNETRVTSVT